MVGSGGGGSELQVLWLPDLQVEDQGTVPLALRR